jgi:hypothetical protein
MAVQNRGKTELREKRFERLVPFPAGITCLSADLIVARSTVPVTLPTVSALGKTSFLSSFFQ